MIVVGLIRLTVSFVNWVSRLYLPEDVEIHDCSLVSILIPARNEENNIGKLLEDISTLTYRSLEVIVYNDSSSDRTKEIVERYIERCPFIKIINGTTLPKGWLGKNFACHQLAQAAKGKTLLFLDADVRIGKGIVEKTVSYMRSYHLKLLSVFPTQHMPSLGTYLAVPLMNWILLSLLPLPLIRMVPGQKALAAANGQFMCFDAETYFLLQPHRMVKGNQVEDIAIIMEYKQRKLNVATLLGGEDISCTMYSSLQEAINGFSKNVFRFFGDSTCLTVLYGMLTTMAPFYLWIFCPPVFFIMYIIIILLIRLFVSLASHQSVIKNILLMIPQQLVFLGIIIQALVKHKQRNII